MSFPVINWCSDWNNIGIGLLRLRSIVIFELCSQNYANDVGIISRIGQVNKNPRHVNSRCSNATWSMQKRTRRKAIKQLNNWIYIINLPLYLCVIIALVKLQWKSCQQLYWPCYFFNSISTSPNHLTYNSNMAYPTHKKYSSALTFAIFTSWGS